MRRTVPRYAARMRGPSRRVIVGGAVALGVLVVAVALRRPPGDRNEPPAAREPEAVAAGERPRPTKRPAPSNSEPPAQGGTPDLEEMQTPWAAVDLNALRAELPDNLYWKMASPTKDPAVIEERAAERERWNVEYGKILSNTATPDEIDTYYAYRYRLSSDYIQFATYLLADYGDRLDARDVGLLKVAVELHMARLEEIPRQIAEAHERCAAHDAVRRAWLESQKAFDPEKKD